LTWADIVFASVGELLEKNLPGVLDNYSNIKALIEKVINLPGIKEYRANRPM